MLHHLVAYEGFVCEWIFAGFDALLVVLVLLDELREGEAALCLLVDLRPKRRRELHHVLDGRSSGPVIRRAGKEAEAVDQVRVEAFFDLVEHDCEEVVDLLSGSDLSGSNLSGSDLSDSNLSDSNLRGSDLSDSNLSDSDLSGSDLSGSNLRGSNLSGSDLRGSNLRDSDLVIAAGWPDGWQAFGWLKEGIIRVQVGCRDLTLEEGRKYWTGKEDRREVLAALDYIERVAKLRDWKTVVKPTL